MFNINQKCELWIESIHIRVNTADCPDVEIRGKVLLDIGGESRAVGRPISVEFQAGQRAKAAVIELLAAQGFKLIPPEAGDDIESRDLAHTVGWPHTRTCNLPEEHAGECSTAAYRAPGDKESQTDYRESHTEGGKP